MSTEFVAGHLDVRAFANESGVLTARDRMAGFGRLSEETGGRAGDRAIDWQARGELRDSVGGTAQVWLHLTAEAVFPMICQRCLGPADLKVAIDRSFRFVATEAQAEAEDELADEDVLVLERSFDLLRLIEDEFLMALPVIPRHEICPTPVQLVAQDPAFEEVSSKQANPFAVLAKLQTGKPS
jgi:uncharacterized protein